MPLLVVQERRRLYRESMTACLKRQLGAFDVIEGVADAAGLLRLAESRQLDHAVIEVDGVPWTWPCWPGACVATTPWCR